MGVEIWLREIVASRRKLWIKIDDCHLRGDSELKEPCIQTLTREHVPGPSKQPESRQRKIRTVLPLSQSQHRR